jgi:hypothetical protein
MLSLRPLLVFPSFASSLLLLVCVFSSGGFGRNVFASQITEIAQLTDGHRDQFGAFVAMSADAKTIVVSNPEPAGGNVYVFVEPPGGWTTTSTHMAVLKVPQSVAAEFGWSVVISPDGNTLAVGAPWTNEFEGEAFVFVKPVTGWQSTSKFTAMLSASDESPDVLALPLRHEITPSLSMVIKKHTFLLSLAMVGRQQQKRLNSVPPMEMLSSAAPWPSTVRQWR